MSQQYTEEQIADIEAREKKALDFLKELQLNPAAQLSKLNLGNDTFVDKIVCYLQDFKYTKGEPAVPAEGVVSPIQAENV